jgi:hypothetical protein
MDTDEFIKHLAADLQPVRPLKRPLARAILWLGLAFAYVVAVVWSKLMLVDPAQIVVDTRFLIEQAATIATALIAAIAAFGSVIPGFDRRMLLLLPLALGVWLASVGQGCMQDWLRFGTYGLSLRPDWDCLPSAVMIAIPPAAALVAMLRKGAPLRPRLTLALAALAVASVTNFGLQFAHVRDASIMVLVWHLGAAAVLSALGGSLGQIVLGRRRPRWLTP